MTPDQGHEAAIKVCLHADKSRVVSDCAEELVRPFNIHNAIQYQFFYPVERQSNLSDLFTLRFGWFECQLPPGIALGQQRIHIDDRPHPRRVSELEVEAAALKHCGEVEIPVEEALLFGDPLCHLQPGMCLENRLDPGGSTRKRPLAGLELVKFCPIIDVEHRCLSCFAGSLV